MRQVAAWETWRKWRWGSAQPIHIGDMDVMRPTSSAFLGAVLVVASAQLLTAAETGSRWWPFGRRDDAQAAQPPRGTTEPLSQSPATSSSTREETTKDSWMLSSPNRKVGWPRLARPEMPKLFAEKPESDATRNSWVEKTPPEPKASPLEPIRTGAKKVASGTKSAWNKTVDALTPGDPAPQPRPNSSRIARSDTEPTFWNRMFGKKEEVRQPQTVPEWMAQDRVDRR